MTIHPIRTPQDHKRALARLDEIWAPKPGTPEGDEFEVLGTLVAAYEAVAFPIGPPTPIEAIEFRLEQQGLTKKDLEPIIGTRARVFEIMKGKRSLTLPMIRRLHAKLHIPLEALVAECVVSPTKRNGRSVVAKSPRKIRAIKKTAKSSKIRA
jgi:HTH-type transcriptional regulator / antitoxin HigA